MSQTEVLEKIKTHILCPVKAPPPPHNRSVYGIVWKDIVAADRPQMKIWRIRTACWIRKARNTHSEYVTINVFPLKRWLQELTSSSGYTYVSCQSSVVEILLQQSWNSEFI
jgi:hypothetical protein